MRMFAARFFLVVGLMFGVGAQGADAVGLSDLKDIIKGFVKNGEKHICKEGKLFSFSPRVTLRSFEGEGCKNFREIFYFSRMVCQKGIVGSSLYKEYTKSQCNKKGQEKWGDLSLTVAKDQLIEHGIRKGTAVTKIILQTSCVAIGTGSLVVQPELAPLIGMACTAAKTAGIF
ncbi:MAG TPA: hypothetical protein DD412_01130 [Holosporales bacterium]|nr:hypothetical protein [Holosporales bacterium]